MAESAAALDWNLDEEADLCRVCRTEAEDSKPLIYPCKCSGSVRYVHSDCLQEWLSHSRKRYCEICGHHYTFTKVYPASLPSTIPFLVYARQSLYVAGHVTWRVFRAWLAIVTWLVVLPCVTMTSLRIVLVGADYITFPSLSYGVRNAIIDSWADLNNTLALNHSAKITGRERVLEVIAQNRTLDILPSLGDKMAEDAKNIVAFVFRGQIIAISIAAGLIGLILLREWIGQHDWNARTTVDEEDEEELHVQDWAFRNGYAIRLARGPPQVPPPPLLGRLQEPVDREEQEAGDVETVVETLVDEGQHDADGENDTGASANPPRPSPSFVAYAPPEQMAFAEASSSTGPSWTSNVEAGPSRPAADVPTGTHSPEDSPTAVRYDWTRESSAAFSNETERSPGESRLAHISGDQSPHGHYYATDGSPLENTSSPAKDVDETANLETVTNASGQPEPSPDLRRASDPGPSRPNTPPVEQYERVDRQWGSHGPPTHGPEDSPLIDINGDQPSPNGSLLINDNDNLTVPDPLEVRGGPSSQPITEPPTPAETATPGGDGARTPADEVALRARIPALEALARIDTDDADTDDVEMGEDPEADAEAERVNDDEDEAANAVLEAALGRQRIIDRAAELEQIGPDLLPEDDDDRPLDADDWDGIFEVIGFIGPLTGLIHNNVFVSIAMACTLTALVGTPVIIGKLALSTDFIRGSSDLFFFLLRCTALACDIVVDITLVIINEVLALPRLLLRPALKAVVDVPALELSSPLNLTSIFGHLGPPSFSMEQVVMHNYTTPVVGVAANKLMDGLEIVGESSYSAYKAARLLGISIAASPDPTDKIWCMIAGYVTIGSAMTIATVADAAKFFELSDGFVEKAGGIIVFLKVVFFMVLEIVAFPLFVGGMIDMCILPLLSLTVSDRLNSLAEHPFGTLFVAWLIGTVFMFSFATFLTHMRTICRTGALYFIRDPSDPSHSPVKDIMERPALMQLSRLAMSAVMYAVIVFAVWGIVPSLLWLTNGWTNFLPLRLDQRPLSSVPFDLLFLHLVLPPSWEGLRIYHRLKRGLAYWWTYTIRMLELSSLIFGLPESNKGAESKRTQMFWLVADAIFQGIFGHYDNRATSARVPNSDRVESLPSTERRREGMLIPLDHTGAPRAAADKLRLLKQDRAARRVGRDPMRDYTVVKLPDFWRTRIYVLVGLALLTACLVTAALVFVPLAVGRQVTGLLFETTVFDGYSWLFGGYLCWGSYATGNNAKKRIVQWSRAARLRRSKLSTRIKRSIFSALRSAYAVMLLYFVLPLLLGINFELFISLPVRYGFSSQLTPVLHVWDAWGMGIVLISLYVGAVGFVVQDHHPLPNRPLPRGQRFRDAFKRPLDQATPTRFGRLNAFVLPLVFWLLLPITAPWVVFLGLCAALQFVGLSTQVDNSWPFRMMYPITSAGLVVWACWRPLRDIASRVRQWVIDAEYVVEERVENYEPDPTTIEDEGRGGEGGAVLLGSAAGVVAVAAEAGAEPVQAAPNGTVDGVALAEAGAQWEEEVDREEGEERERDGTGDGNGLGDEDGGEWEDIAVLGRA